MKPAQMETKYTNPPVTDRETRRSVQGDDERNKTKIYRQLNTQTTHATISHTHETLMIQTVHIRRTIRSRSVCIQQLSGNHN